MNKTLIALAVAGIVAAPMAAQAEVAVNGSIGLQYSTYSGTAVDDLSSDDSSINFTASSETDSGSTAYMRIRFDASLSGAGVGGDAIKVGIKGDFGDFGLGEQGNPVDMGQRANDVHDLTGNNNSISYKNSIGAISFQITTSPEGNDETTGGGFVYDGGMFKVGYGTLSDDSTGGTSDISAYGVSTSFGSISLDAHVAEAGTDDITAVRVGWADGPLAIAYTLSTLEQVGLVDEDATSLQVRYHLGGGLDVEVEIEDKDIAGSPGLDYTRIMLEYSF